MLEKLIIAGAGGQGVMLLGKVLAESAMQESRQVTWFPSYGAEVRGGTAHCMVTVSDWPIASPYIDEASIVIIMNQPSLERFGPRLKKNGRLILNSSLVSASPAKKAQTIFCPCTEIAVGLGNIRVANMVALGCLVSFTRLVSPLAVYKAMEYFAGSRPDLLAVNKKAFEKGLEFCREALEGRAYGKG